MGQDNIKTGREIMSSAKDNTNFRHSYDQKADVLYINFGDDEPTFVEELEEDFIMLEIGWFTGLPKGFRIISPKKNKLSGVQIEVVTKHIKKELKSLFEAKIKNLRQQEPVMTSLLTKDFSSFLRNGISV